nr:hypothetical protein [Micromonospora sp. DSM 115978]
MTEAGVQEQTVPERSSQQRSLRARLAEATARLGHAGVPSPAADASALAAAALGVTRGKLAAIDVMTPEAARRFDELVAGRQRRIP